MHPLVFAYDFPHKKTQDLVTRLAVCGHKPVAILAAPALELRIPPAAVRVKARHQGLLEPRTLATSLGIPYHVVDHRADECLLYLDEFNASVGVVAGARILPSAVLERFSHGIVNLHPGLLPDTRGLDALQWALFRNLSLGVTAHLIDHRVDAGRLLERRLIDEYPDDTLVDLSLRLYETQLEMVCGALTRALSMPSHSHPVLCGGNYNRSFPRELVPMLKERFRMRRMMLRRGYSVAGNYGVQPYQQSSGLT